MNASMPEGPMSEWLERAWLARYLERQLTAEEAAWFEAYALDKEELLDAIEADSALRDALASAGRPALEAGVAKEADTRRVVRHLPNGRWTWIGAAAALVVGIGVGRFAGERGGPDVIANPSRLVFDTLRGDQVAPSVDHSDSASPYLVIEVAVPPAAQDVVLEIEGDDGVALTPSTSGFVSVLVRRSLVEAGRVTKVRYVLGGERRSRILDVGHSKGRKP